ncbi:hypothetical protein M427DRAFT_280792 [Gonapodya prolifera JEL478]|uniref:Uncharacterized protein n=1 Tax=Gonapodya prolifera (strain JEL478) TaxID=1344416 RepID=A0A139AYS2_GONPJ|nr:hypothetical protein M427DRAFT_280792 [Gonapodya prolifera JEL478]|eukprot:KXS21876.1 hypothetical protein M427DRAFT_280792 [Gonapodya prolifera JEL478]
MFSGKRKGPTSDLHGHSPAKVPSSRIARSILSPSLLIPFLADILVVAAVSQEFSCQQRRPTGLGYPWISGVFSSVQRVPHQSRKDSAQHHRKPFAAGTPRDYMCPPTATIPRAHFGATIFRRPSVSSHTSTLLAPHTTSTLYSFTSALLASHATATLVSYKYCFASTSVPQLPRSRIHFCASSRFLSTSSETPSANRPNPSSPIRHSSRT